MIKATSWANIHHLLRTFFLRKTTSSALTHFAFQTKHCRSFLFNMFYSRFLPESRDEKQTRCHENLLYIYQLKGSFISFHCPNRLNILSTPQHLPFQFDSVSSVCCFTAEAVRRKCNIAMHDRKERLAIFNPFLSLNKIRARRIRSNTYAVAQRKST